MTPAVQIVLVAVTAVVFLVRLTNALLEARADKRAEHCHQRHLTKPALRRQRPTP